MEEEEQQHRHLPEQNYETDVTTYDFIYFVQDYSDFLKQYIKNKYRDEADDIGYYTSFIDICDEINTDYGDDRSFEQYRPTLEPLMEWITLWAEDMNKFYGEQQKKLVEPKGIAHRTRSKQPDATDFEISPSKRGTNIITLEPTKQEAVRITLSDGKSYTYDEIKDMWRSSKVQTPYRHNYTEQDKQKITDLIEFATKGGKRKTRKSKKPKKSRKQKNKKKSRRK